MRLLVLALLTTTASPQFILQHSNSSASFRGVHAVSDKIAWVSGTQGTVLHTTDGGEHWLPCSTPQGAEKLDFRGIQAFDASTAIVMSSGKGDSSRLYKTRDACKTWTLLFTNPDPEGFWDSIAFPTPGRGWLLGDSVQGSFVLMATFDGGLHWERVHQDGLKEPDGGGGAFAASNSLILPHLPLVFGTGNSWYYQGDSNCTMSLRQEHPQACLSLFEFKKQQLPMAHGPQSAGIFSVAEGGDIIVAVGGDYKQPDNSSGTAAYSTDRGLHWQSASKPPGGYRSSVVQTMDGKLFLAVGPNGTDASCDGGRTWHALGNDSERSRNWNALSLPFVVGPNGRIGRAESLTLTGVSNGTR